ncbi:MAG: hypothetical protein ACD_60C00160G0038 [uncultured bacterium]|nr:MAG: hypothetical protein ACD_60C00160G0038 [uncultured bacterium]
MTKNKKNLTPKLPPFANEAREGLLIVTMGAQADIEDEEGKRIHCHVRKNADPIITGDRIYWLPEQDGTGTIIGHAPRKSLLSRLENSQKQKLVAANIDAIIIVTAPFPPLSVEKIDRYLIAAENLNIPCIILLNKADLLDPQNKESIKTALEIYEKIGYPVLYSSTYTPDGLTNLQHYLDDKTCVLVGASGVGKSSIIAKLTSGENIKIGDLSHSTQLGKHTTTSTRLYHLTKGGHLIDSPGVREFGIGQLDKSQILQGFKEFKPYLKQCKFRDCYHQTEPGCAIKQAASDKKISEERLQSYYKILNDR